MDIDEIVKCVNKLEDRLFLKTTNAEQTCVNITFELYSDKSCALKYHWQAKSLKAAKSDEERMLNNILAMLNSDRETVKIFDNIEDFQRFLIDQNLY